MDKQPPAPAPAPVAVPLQTYPQPYGAPGAAPVQAYAVQPVPGQPIYVQPMPGQPIMVTTVQYGKNPQNVTCPTCKNQVMTQTTTENGLAMWLAVGGCCLLTGCCCWIPLLISDLKDVSHDCPVCKTHLGDAKLIK
ncbi:cell death-inducing p53 target 1 [Polyrhizophydium stewartii]|uniref:Cell death-inducing p53 target 1 n=1 Tax=Polyrhizophydium stewartii TaxID=2732419 RepID=A0ABR4ND37_9FUNG|nr:cell death-inducing p53 target 1 [Polyrhizophydium stewartii]